MVESLKLSFGQEFEAKFWSRCFSWNLINLHCDLKAVTVVKAPNPWVRCALGNIFSTFAFSKEGKGYFDRIVLILRQKFIMTKIARGWWVGVREVAGGTDPTSFGLHPSRSHSIKLPLSFG